MASIFTKIVNGEIPSMKVAEDDQYLAFLDVNPVAPGHVLVIPKKEIDYIFDMEDDHYVGLQLFVKKVARGLEKAMPCERVGVAVVGLEVPHVHIHLLPLNSMEDINFSKPKLSLPKEKMEEIQAKIRSEVKISD